MTPTMNDMPAHMDPRNSFQGLILTLQRFWAEQRHATRRFAAGARNTLFPYGTLQMRQRFRVRCRGPSPAERELALAAVGTASALSRSASPPDSEPLEETTPSPRAPDDYSDF